MAAELRDELDSALRSGEAQVGNSGRPEVAHRAADWTSSVDRAEAQETAAPGRGRRSMPTAAAAATGDGTQQPAVRQRPRSAAAVARSSPAPRAGRSSSSSSSSGSCYGDEGVEVHPWSLSFRDASLESEFAAHYGQFMWRTDLASCLLHLCFYCTILFTPGPLGYLGWKLPWGTIACGLTYMYWMPIIAIPRLRAWYLGFRDPCLVSLLACMACYMISTGNHQRWVDPEFATHPMFQGGFSWIAFSLFFFQPRIRYHRYSAALLFAAQAPALRSYCRDHFVGHLGSCHAIGAFKILVLVLVPLAAVYCLEARVRRMFLRRA